MSQTQTGNCQAVTPCSCSSYVTIDDNDHIVDYGDVGPFTSARCYFIVGTLIIDDPEAEWISVRIKMAEGSQIIVETGLQLIGTYISGCGDMWKGIKTGSSANLSLYRSTIEDAEFGISLGNFNGFHCEKSNFINDYVGITMGSPFDADIFDQQVLLKGEIYGCKFYTSTTLPDPYPGQFYYPDWPTSPSEIPYNMGYAAVYLSGTSGFNLGFVGAEGSDRNEIYQMRNGVILRYSVMNLAGTDIHDLEGNQPRAIASPQRDLNQFGINGFFSFSDIEDNTMESLMDGAWMAQSANTIKDNTFDILNSGVAVLRTEGIFSQRPQKLNVLNNDVTNGYHGIHVTLANTGFEIKDNTLDRQGLPWLNTGIDVRSSLLTLRREGVIQNNELNITDGDFSLGIYLNSARQLDIDDNNLYFLVNEGVGNAIRGIGAVGLAHSIIHRNNVDPDAEYQPTNASYGIQLFNSNMNNVVCNDIEHSRANIFVLGSNSETQLIGNNIINGVNGLVLYREVNMGTQVHNANLWLGTPDDCGASIYIQDDDDAVSIAMHNRFIINDIYDNSEFRPDPICPEEVEGDVWFKSENDLINENPNEPCNNLPDPYPIVDTLVHRIRTALDFEEYNDQMEWMEKADIFEYMLIDPSLHSNTVLDSFFDVEESNPLGILINAQFQLSSRFKTILADKNDVLDSIQIFSDSLVYIDSILALSPSDSATWMALRELKVDSLTESFGRWQDILTDEEDESFNTYDNIRNILKFLTTGNDLEAYLKEALVLRCQYLLGEGFNATDSADIYDLARLCPWEGGRAIPIAHELYTIVADSTLLPVTDCPPPPPRPVEERNAIDSHVIGLSVSPNPSSGFIQITSDRQMEEIWITNSDGRTVLKLNPQNTKISVYLNNEPSGLYLITIKYQDHIEHKSILLIK